ncbi:Uma2 family endonuclease [Cyanobacterium aponinum UTEX 3222]|uniref:Uma2 family endonuclease n=1 Tax=Cyanobacterium aponinum TaxID=379064 RepID=UPI0016812ED8|nr:Uma2 family endonuclease [Cyanobacterium aponinum]MBD2393207.1 Uma2 family endonuclease [Cyanobacterium aponinum FACHB-4101]WRL40501.1 Uma2 family endonuclease [Cyanobacterium aponinum UTEX 3222]
MVAIQETIKGSNLSPEEYLTQEEKALTKHEYINGEVYEMAGASSAHVTISLNVASLLKAHLKGSNCRVFISDMKVRIDRLNVFYYPDVIVACNEKDRELNYYKKAPQIIIEVLSESTESFDRGDKFADYRTIETLQEYVLISQTKKRVDLFTRKNCNSWELSSFSEGEKLTLNSINFTCSVLDLYEDIDVK